MIVAPLFNPVDWKTAVSCASGKLLAATAPPPVVAQPVSDQLPPAAKFQYLLTPAPNVIPLLPLQSPNRVPLTGAAAPAMVMSRKSASVPEKAAQVSVRVVPSVSERTNVRIVASVPAESVSVPLMVWLSVTETTFKPAAVIPVTDKLLKVFAPLSVTVPADVLVKLTL